MTPKTSDFLNRYTSLPVLLDILARRQITLLSPDSWEDKNDTFFVNEYKKRKELNTVLGVCFSSVRETFHHWKVFAPGSSGVCIEFSRRRILEKVKASDGFLGGNVKYHLISDFNTSEYTANDLPFIKRKPYNDEQEYRILYTHKTDDLTSIGLKIELSWIHKVTLSPNLPEPLFNSVKDVIENAGFSGLRISPSTLLENERWKELALRIR